MIQIRQGTVEEVVEISNQIPELKNPYQAKDYRKRFQTKHIILIAELSTNIVGFKCGYERIPGSNIFYSWMGGVLPEYRKSGVASNLLNEMESWCVNEGYEILEFKTLNEHKSMLIFSLKYGFEITGVIESPKDARKRIVLQKRLKR